MRLLHVAIVVVLLIAAAADVEAQLVFVRGTDNALWMREGTAWKKLGGQITSAPDGCSWGSGRIDVFARGADNALVQIARVGDRWSEWFNLGGSLSGGPAAVSWGPNRIDVFAVGSDRTMQHKAWDGTRWSAWESLGGEFPAGSTPDVASWGPNRLDVFARGMEGGLWQIAWEGSGWSDWIPHGGVLTSDPGAVSWGPNRIDVFARGSDGQVVQIAWDGTAWSEWFQHGGTFAAGSGVDASSLATGRLEVYGRGANNAVVRKAWDGTRWSEWDSLGGVIASDPGAVVSRGGAVRFRAEVENILRAYLMHRPGGAASVGVVDRAGNLYFWNYGQIEPGVPASEDSVYSIGSNSKVLTGTLIKMISEAGRINLDQPAQQYLPAQIVLPIGYPDPSNTGVRTYITPRHILTHRSGLPRDFASPEFDDMRLENFVRLFSAVTLTRIPGTGPIAYSNIGSELATAMVEHVDGRSYAESLRARLTTPLGMRSTAPHLIIHPRLPKRKIGYPEGGGYVQSTARDMLKYLKAASRWDVEGVSGPILRSQTNGLFWFGNELPGAFHHNGANPATDSATYGWHKSGMMADPASQMGVIVLTQGHPEVDEVEAVYIARDIIRLARGRTNGEVVEW